MNGAWLAGVVVAIVLLAWLARPERRWFDRWDLEDRREFRRAIPAGLLSALVVMALIAAALAAGPVVAK